MIINTKLLKTFSKDLILFSQKMLHSENKSTKFQALQIKAVKKNQKTNMTH